MGKSEGPEKWLLRFWWRERLGHNHREKGGDMVMEGGELEVQKMKMKGKKKIETGI